MKGFAMVRWLVLGVLLVACLLAVSRMFSASDEVPSQASTAHSQHLLEIVRFDESAVLSQKRGAGAIRCELMKDSALMNTVHRALDVHVEMWASRQALNFYRTHGARVNLDTTHARLEILPSGLFDVAIVTDASGITLYVIQDVRVYESLRSALKMCDDYP